MLKLRDTFDLYYSDFLPIHFDSEGGEGVAVVKLLVFVNDFFLLTENVIAHYIKKVGNYFFFKNVIYQL